MEWNNSMQCSECWQAGLSFTWEKGIKQWTVQGEDTFTKLDGDDALMENECIPKPWESLILHYINVSLNVRDRAIAHGRIIVNKNGEAGGQGFLNQHQSVH